MRPDLLHDAPVRLSAATLLSIEKARNLNEVSKKSFDSKFFFQKNSFTYIDRIVDLKKRKGPPMGLSSELDLDRSSRNESWENGVLELGRLLKANQDSLVILNLRRKFDGKLCYKVLRNDMLNKFGSDKVLKR